MPAKTNMFAKKKATAKKETTAKKDDKIIVVIPGSEFDEKLKRFNALKVETKNLEAELKGLEGDIKAEGVEKFVELYEKGQRNPGSFKIASDSGEKVMVIAMDRYLKVDDERAEELKEEFGEDVISEEYKFAFNGRLLEKFQEEISELIMNAPFMTDDEKAELIVTTVALSIKKGAINEAMTLGKGEVADFLGSIQPVLHLKQTTN